MLNPELIAGVRRFDPQAIEAVFLKTHDKAYSVAYHVLRDEYEAEDIVQDAYITMMEKVNTLNDSGRFESWFYQIVKNAALDQLRKRRPDPFSNFENDLDSDFRFEDTLVSDYTPFDPEATADYAELQRIMQGLIRELPEMQRQCIVLRFHNDMKIGDIARKLGIPESTVKSNLTYGKKKIEAEVRAMEKQGVKLYSLTPLTVIAFLRWMWGNSVPTSIAAKAASGAAATTAAAASGGAASAGTATAAGGASANGAGGVTAAAKAGISLTAKKVVAGVCAAAVVTSATVGAVLLNAETKLKDILRVEKQGFYSDFVDVGYCVPQFTPDTEGYRQLNQHIMQAYEEWEYLYNYFADTPERQEFLKRLLQRDCEGEIMGRWDDPETNAAMADPSCDGFPMDFFDFSVDVYKLGPFFKLQISSSMYALLYEQEWILQQFFPNGAPQKVFDEFPSDYQPCFENNSYNGLFKIEDGTPASWEDVAAACGLSISELSAYFTESATQQIDELRIPEPDRSILIQDYTNYFTGCNYVQEQPSLIRQDNMAFFFHTESSAPTISVSVRCPLPGEKTKNWEIAVCKYSGVEFTSGTNQ